MAHEIIFVILHSKPVLNQEKAVAALPIADSDLLGLFKLVVLVYQHHSKCNHWVCETPHFLYWLNIRHLQIFPKGCWLDPDQLGSIGDLCLLGLRWIGTLVNYLERSVIVVLIGIVVNVLVLVLSEDSLLVLLGIAQKLRFICVLLKISIC